MTNTCRAVYPMKTDCVWELVFVDDDGDNLTFEEAKQSLYPDLHDDFRGPFATAAEANDAVADFVAQTPGCGYFPDEYGGATLASD